MTQLYYKYSTYLKERFGERVQKISVDAGFSCPNRDGRISTGGCIFCDNQGFSPNSRTSVKPVEQQIAEGIDFYKKRYSVRKFIVYFQAYSNTYAPVEMLRQRYDVIKQFDEVVGISIGTRPDCVDESIMTLIDSYAECYEVWIEYGLQTIHEKTLSLINRGHGLDAFERAHRLTREKERIKIAAHIILGLPGETLSDIIVTAKYLAGKKIDGIKMHPLHIFKGTELEKMYRDEQFTLLTMDEYLAFVINALEYTHPSTVIQRLIAGCPRELLVGPSWINKKSIFLDKLSKKMTELESFQGKSLERL